MDTPALQTTNADGKIACKVRSFEQRHAFGPHPPGAVVYIDPDELKIPAIRNALITVEEDERQRREAEEKIRAASEERIASFERDRESVIASQRAAKEAEERRMAATQPGPVTAPSSAPGRAPKKDRE